MQLDRLGLSAISRARIISSLVSGRRRLLGARGAIARRWRIASSLDQTPEVRRRRYRNKVVARGQPRNAVIAQVICALGADLLPVTASRDESLAQQGDLRLSHGIAIFICHAPFHHCRGLQTDD